MATDREWSAAYAKQASADFDAYNSLTSADLPACQSLHFLQMACEKLVKAHLCEEGTDPYTLQSSHAYPAKTLPVVLKGQLIAQGDARLVKGLMPYIKSLAGEIEVLAPAVTRGRARPDNCEYPWEDDSGRLWVPIEYQFIAQALVERPQWGQVLKLIRAAILRFVADG